MFANYLQQRLRLGAQHFPFGGFKRRSQAEWYLLAALIVYAAICIVVYFAYVAPWIAGDISTRIGADSDRYWEFVTYVQSLGSALFLFTTGSSLGPVTIGFFLHYGFAVMCFNFLLLILAIKIAASIPNVNVGVFGLLLLINAELLPSLTTLNKEILALFSAVLIAKYLYSPRPSIFSLLGVLLVAAFSRWEAGAVLILYLFLKFVFRGHPKTALVCLIIFITVAFPVYLRVLGLDLSSFDWLMQDANTILTLNKIEYAYGFPLVVIPKIIMVMAGVWVSPAYYTANPVFIRGFTDLQQQIFQPIGDIAMMAVFAYAVWTKRMRLTNPIAVFVATTLIVTAATPFVQPRYLYGAYTMLCIELARPKHLYGVTESTGTRMRKLFVGGKKPQQDALGLGG
jgi:hypothetical protein